MAGGSVPGLGDWLGFAGNVVGGAVGAAVAIGLWIAERARDDRAWYEAGRKSFLKSRAALELELSSAEADLNQSSFAIETTTLTVDSFANDLGGAPEDLGSLKQYPGFAGLREELSKFVQATRQQSFEIRALEEEHVQLLGIDFCTEYNRVRRALSSFRKMQRSIREVPRDPFELFEIQNSLQYLSNTLTDLLGRIGNLQSQMKMLYYDHHKRR